MRQVVLPRIGTVSAWRAAARSLLADAVPATGVIWSVGAAVPDLFDTPGATGAVPVGRTPASFTLPRAALSTIDAALCHSDPQRFSRLYDCVVRLADGRLAWGDRRDHALRIVLAQAKAVARDVHKTHAFVRFREVPSPGPRRRFAAWFEPEHPSLERSAPFFARRFGDMDWVIATPTVTARCEEGVLAYSQTNDTGVPAADATEALWLTYYASIFNPARLMPRAMQAEMPRKFWRNLPEAKLIPGLIAGAETRVAAMAERLASEPPARRGAVARAMAAAVPKPASSAGSIDALRAGAISCTRCPLHATATQTVFGQGPTDAQLMIVGEQPGDTEDLSGLPFVGPAGDVLRSAAAEAGLNLGAAYLTNAVKHFKFTPRGKRRLHQRPMMPEIEACKWWLEQERDLVRPRLILALGATALMSLTGTGTQVATRRGRVEKASDGTDILPTFHPSYLLRLPDKAAQDAARALFVDDLRAAAARIGDRLPE